METLEAVNREGRERLYPRLTNPSWLILRKRREIFQRWLDRLQGHDLAVLDIGGRIQPYRPLLEGRIRSYVAADLLRTPLVSIVARAECLPLATGQFDVVICTQVLQYIPQPSAVVAEIYRVLKPGGVLLLSVPSACPRDADHECWRFLPAVLRQLLANFETVEVVPEGGSITGFFRSINFCLYIFARFPQVRSLFRYTVFPAVNVLGAFVEKISSSRNDQFAANYSVHAQKLQERAKSETR
jgi:SAM-dependent methyltransferase